MRDRNILHKRASEQQTGKDGPGNGRSNHGGSIAPYLPTKRPLAPPLILLSVLDFSPRGSWVTNQTQEAWNYTTRMTSKNRRHATFANVDTVSST